MARRRWRSDLLLDGDQRWCRAGLVLERCQGLVGDIVLVHVLRNAERIMLDWWL
jgi:hypothetical protein